MTTHPTVAIVGAGAVGLTVAHDLARKDADVTVYERGQVAAGSSGRAAGVCYDAFASRPDARIGQEAIDRFREFARDGAPFTSCPYVWLVQEGDEQRERRVREGIERMCEVGVDATELDACDLAERFPALRSDDIAVAGVTTGAGYTDPGEYTAWLASKARDVGATIETEIPVEIGTDPPRVMPEADSRLSREIEVDALVVAAGAHARPLLADADVPIAMKPYRVQALVGTVSLAETGESWEPMVYDASANCYLRPHPEGLLAGNGTEEVEADPDEYERRADEGFAADLTSRITHRLPGCALDVRKAWAGLCTATPDRNPLVGEIREDVYIATGFQGQGFMRSPAIGRRLADEILDGETLDGESSDGNGIDAFDPTRFDGDEAFDVREGMAIE